MMHMTFYWGKNVTILFDSWNTDSWASYSLTLLLCFLVSVVYQSMEDRRLRLKLFAAGKKPLVVSSQNMHTALLNPGFVASSRWRKSAKFLVAVMFGINSAVGYMLMLAVMSFNGGVFIAVVLGLSVGYLVFRSDDEELSVVENPCA
ncbi:PREDICTED: copper transporter 5.1 [Nelumbo nucifera]|uniref:Copper transport protein n=2 Tax=Nelumbo nucifera TaxID=4432 RepID=A0A822YBE2_NELNU|nr:PREDICTED: copper transporter 5.1 [Nelumbo nucifera]DAD29632.1 TPA_asm: hypothetical protein HUJ06_031100 [Nelumbo nucifera]